MKITDALNPALLNKIPAVPIPMTDLTTAPLDLVLAGVGLRMQQLARGNEAFKALLDRKASLRIATVDGIGRTYQIDHGKVSHDAEVGTPDFTLTFDTAEQALTALIKGDAVAIMSAIQEGTIKVDGDFTLLMWFQQVAQHLVPRVPPAIKDKISDACELLESKKDWLLDKKANLLGQNSRPQNDTAAKDQDDDRDQGTTVHRETDPSAPVEPARDQSLNDDRDQGTNNPSAPANLS